MTPNPVAVNTAITLTANVDDTTNGGSNIASAAYTVDGGAGGAMTAQDGSFDEVSEGVSASAPVFAVPGVHNICVSGRTRRVTRPKKIVLSSPYMIRALVL